MTDTLIVGQTYRFVHPRKGAFTGEVTAIGTDFVTVTLTRGRARFMARDDAGPGETIEVRISLLRWTPLPH